MKKEIVYAIVTLALIVSGIGIYTQIKNQEKGELTQTNKRADVTNTIKNVELKIFEDINNRFTCKYSPKFRVSCGGDGFCTMFYCDQIKDCDINNVDGSDNSYVFKITPINIVSDQFESLKKVSPGSAFKVEPDRIISGATLVARASGLHKNFYLYNNNQGVLFSGVGTNHQELEEIVNSCVLTK